MAKFFLKCSKCGSTNFEYKTIGSNGCFDGLFICNNCDIEIEPHNLFYDLEKIENNVLYENSDHRKRVLELLKKYNKIYAKYDNEVDLEYYPAYYLLSLDMLKDKTIKYIDEDGIDFDQMLHNEDFSTSQELIIKLAQHLFNRGTDVSIVDLLGSLDENHYEIVLQAIKLRRKSLFLEEI